MLSEIDPLMYYTQMRKDGIILSFNGAISQNILTDIALGLREKVAADTSTGKVLFATFIELAQNILIHSADRTILPSAEEKGLGNGILLVKETADDFHVISGNTANTTVALEIKEKCDYINSLDEEGLKSYYKEQRKAPLEEGKGGGNIGFIDIARKTGNPILVKLRTIDENNSFLSVYVTVAKKLQN